MDLLNTLRNKPICTLCNKLEDLSTSTLRKWNSIWVAWFTWLLFNYHQFACIGQMNRFEKIRQFFHCNDNSKNELQSDPGCDKLFKVRPVIDSVLEKCMKVPMEEQYSVDEQIIPTKGRSPLKHYLPKNPNKWGTMWDCIRVRSIHRKGSKEQWRYSWHFDGWKCCLSTHKNASQEEKIQVIFW